ncbi:coordinator of PRMT5 and differentiation stimulator isoform X3 [Hirundo rustica]|uniref:coordinator of PRMT5 and differentiation stimulator isoform X3 n=1 Tax=Hirundo rustica TaxID=43150 RepID=UPI001A950B9E|nr:coordinator of PRMT5 and differentiation stimulator isoform X3 [Hirundo rustica]
MAAASEAANSEGKQLPNKTETVIWKPRKECLLQNIPNVPDGTSEESVSASTSPNEGDVSGSTDEGWYNIYADLDVWDSEVSNIPESSVQQDVSEHEVEDWDKELEESTYGPYGDTCLQMSLIVTAWLPLTYVEDDITSIPHTLKTTGIRYWESDSNCLKE